MLIRQDALLLLLGHILIARPCQHREQAPWVSQHACRHRETAVAEWDAPSAGPTTKMCCTLD